MREKGLIRWINDYDGKISISRYARETVTSAARGKRVVWRPCSLVPTR
jgi:hypothetical protein